MRFHDGLPSRIVGDLCSRRLITAAHVLDEENYNARAQRLRAWNSRSLAEHQGGGRNLLHLTNTQVRAYGFRNRNWNGGCAGVRQ
jgi:hypothetical protein